MSKDDKQTDQLKFDKLCIFEDELSSVPTDTLALNFRKDGNENFASDWLAFLLDPSLSKTTEPLECLLTLAGIFTLPDISDVAIAREEVFGEFGRVDITIRTDEMLILVENKIYAGLGDKNGIKQDVRYMKALEKELSREESRLKSELCKVVLLHPKQNEITHDPKIKEIFHEDLVNKLEDIKVDFIANLRTAFLMEDYIRYMKDLTKKYELPVQMYKYEENYDDIKKAVVSLAGVSENVRKLIKRAVGKLVEDGWEAGSSDQYFQLFKSEWKKGFNIHLELVENREKNTYIPPKQFSVQIHSEKKMSPKADAEFKSIQQEFNKRVKEMNCGKDIVEIGYGSDMALALSIDKAVNLLSEIKKEFADRVDRFIVDVEG